MINYQNLLWGFSLSYPDSWEHRLDDDAVIFLAPLNPDSKDENREVGQVMLRPEWNPARTEVRKLWNLHIGKIAGMIGAKRVGAGPWQLGDMKGMEAELVMPKKDALRLWTGMLVRDRIILHFMVTHHKLDRPWFEPLATDIIRSLRFHAAAAEADDEAIFPLPPEYSPVEPTTVLDDIDDAEAWQAFRGKASVGALQAFYTRELPATGWNIAAYDPVPGPAEPGFARFALQREGIHIVLGLLPEGDEAPPSAQTGTIILRQLPALS